jgi:hypothetical protein
MDGVEYISDLLSAVAINDAVEASGVSTPVAREVDHVSVEKSCKRDARLPQKWCNLTAILVRASHS